MIVSVIILTVMLKNNSRLYTYVVGIFFIIFTAWWVYIDFILKSSDNTNIHNKLFGSLYGLMALFGGLIGIKAAKVWGSNKSLFGRALLFFSGGLLLQVLGQVAYSIYTYVLKVDVPYPSFGDIGFFGSVLFYIYAAYLLANGIGLRITLKAKYKKLVAVILPLILLIASYTIFLKGYQFDFSSPLAGLRVVLDFGYPLGQAIYISIALLAYLLSKKQLGGIMKSKVLWILFALLIQYVSDFTFLLGVKNQTIYPAGYNDMLYLLSYTVLTLSLIKYLNVLQVTQKTTEQVEAQNG